MNNLKELTIEAIDSINDETDWSWRRAIEKVSKKYLLSENETTELYDSVSEAILN